MAAKAALENANVNLILPWAPEAAESEIKSAFVKAQKARKAGKEAAEVADLWFFETVVRLHRAGEGAPYAGLKPAGLNAGPVIPKAEKALETGDCGKVSSMLSAAVKEEVERRFGDAMSKKSYDADDVGAARAYVDAMLDFLLYSHHAYKSIRSGIRHGAAKEGGHGD